jgi:uncharacterized membrane protein
MDSDSPSRSAAYQTDRMKAFSDGVFAIAITLLILEIAVPAGSEDLLGALVDLWPVYLAYFVSFATIGAVWLAHTVITEYLDQADSVLLRLNLLLLMMVSFLPFPTKLLGEFAGETDPQRIAATVYGLNVLLVMITLFFTWRYAVSARLVSPDVGDEDVKTLTKRLTPTLGIYVVTILVGLFVPIIAVVGYLVLALFILVPFSLLRRGAATRTSRNRRPWRRP